MTLFVSKPKAAEKALVEKSFKGPRYRRQMSDGLVPQGLQGGEGLRRCLQASDNSVHGKLPFQMYLEVLFLSLALFVFY